MRFVLLLAALIAGCATPPAPEPQPQPEPPPVVAPPKENLAIAGLMETARTEAAAGNLASAAIMSPQIGSAAAAPERRAARLSS